MWPFTWKREQMCFVERVKCTTIERVINGWSIRLKWMKLNTERLTWNFEGVALNAKRLVMSSWTAHWKFRMDGHEWVNGSHKQCETRWPWTQNFERIAEKRCLANRAETKNNSDNNYWNVSVWRGVWIFPGTTHCKCAINPFNNQHSLRSPFHCSVIFFLEIVGNQAKKKTNAEDKQQVSKSQAKAFFNLMQPPKGCCNLWKPV